MLKKCLVLGGGGFIGSNLCKYLLALDYEVRIFDIKNFSKVNIVDFSDKFEIFEGDFSNPTDIKLALEGIDCVFHLISTTLPSNSVVSPVYDIESNVVPSVRLLQLCVELSIKKIIFVSSGGTVYGIPNAVPILEEHVTNPINSYGITKRTIESYVKLYSSLWGLDACVFRLSNPYGEKQNPNGIQGAIAVFMKKAMSGQDIDIWGDGSVVRDYIYIDDVVAILEQAVNTSTPEVIYNLGSGVGTSLNEILDLIRTSFHYDLKINYLKGRNFDVPHNILDIRLLKSTFQVGSFVDLKDGIVRFHNYLLNRG